MLRLSVDEIVRDVRLCMDEAADNEAEFLLSADQEEMDNLIKSKIADAYRSVHLIANPSLLTTTIEHKEVESDEKGVVRVDVPKTYARIVGVTLDGWSRYVSEFVSNMDKAYAELKNPITTGSKDNPKAALVEKDLERQTLELYSIEKDKSSTCVLSIIPDWGYNIYEEETPGGEEPTEGAESALYNISRKVYRAVVYYTAGLVFQTYKDAQGDTLMQLGLAMVA